MRLVWLAVLGCLFFAACASVERPQYGVSKFRVLGGERMSTQALENCLLTHERKWTGITLGLPSTTCNEPPFDKDVPRLRLIRWPWTDWPSFNPAMLDQDLERIRRWYQARGYYDAQVVSVKVTPEAAVEPGDKLPEGACQPDREDCTVEVLIIVQEGEPIHVASIVVQGGEELDPKLRAALDKNRALPKVGARFDEYDHEQAKLALASQLSEASYATGHVRGEIRVDRRGRKAHLTYRVVPGRKYVVGEVRVTGNDMVPAAPIVAAANFHAGQPFRESVLRDVQNEVYALGAFTSVEVERVLDEERGVANILVHVTPLKKHAYRLGMGLMSGSLQRTETGDLTSVPQWDVHLSGMYERRHVLWGLGKLRLEERPRLIFNEEFPRVPEPKFGNLLKISLNQMGLVERRTDLFTSLQWDYGPDPFLGFFRHDFISRLGLKRGFFRRRLFGTWALQQDVYLVAPDSKTSDGSQTPKSYNYDFVEQDLRLDLRDNSFAPRKGAYLALYTSGSVRWPGSDWSLLRLSPDLRGYVPLPFGMVLAMRWAMAAQFIRDANPDLDEKSQKLGPNAYRLRGGGAQSNRGFVAGELGAGPDGGVRRWEASSELRVRLGKSTALVGFLDFGDVNENPAFRFDYLNGSAGWGARFITPVGSIRLDFGYRVAALRGKAPVYSEHRLPLTDALGAFHLTIGEAF